MKGAFLSEGLSLYCRDGESTSSTSTLQLTLTEKKIMHLDDFLKKILLVLDHI